jgi:3-deoxy-7-phosphoheptulonate synthase
MKGILFLCWTAQALAFHSWSPSSWKSKTLRQAPVYHNQTALSEVTDKLVRKPPLIFAKECEHLKREIGRAANGDAFVIIGGDCAETFDDFETNTIRDLYKMILQMGIFQTYRNGKKTIKIARTGGQFAKPRSQPTETRDNFTLPAYRGDIINSVKFDETARRPDPNRMLQAYAQSAETINLLRAFSSGGFASLYQIQKWNLLSLRKGILQDMKMVSEINQALKFFYALGIPESFTLLTQTELYVGHECLLLPYEQAMTRNDSLSERSYDCSAHFLWIGDRTRFLDSAHVEFCRGVENPIGIKISKTTNVTELIRLIEILNPKMQYGRITLMTRFGVDTIEEYFPPIIHAVRKSCHHVLWCCDPMHGNGKVVNGTKTRFIEENHCIPGGIHLEMTPRNVTECISKKDTMVNFPRYESVCDPRLNQQQAFDLINTI